MGIKFDFTDLEVFLAVAETGSFRRAAEQLAISQSAITRRVQKLEASLATRLFDRTTRSLKLTSPARQLRGRAQAMVNEAVETLHAMGDDSVRFQYQRKAIITIATISTLTQGLLPRVIRQFNNDGHQARISILDLFAHDVVDAVSKGDADFGIGVIGMNEPGLDTKVLSEDFFELAIRRDNPLAQHLQFCWNELQDMPLIVPSKGAGNRMLIDNALASRQLSLNWSYQVQHSSTALGLVAAGVGVAVLPASAIPLAADSLVVGRPLVDPYVSRTIGTFLPGDGVMPEMATIFFNLLVDICGRNSASTR